eukprot:15472079-Alexandrium_andersonii.AAC.1
MQEDARTNEGERQEVCKTKADELQDTWTEFMMLTKGMLESAGATNKDRCGLRIQNIARNA